LNSSRTLMAVERALIAHLDDPWAAESIPMRALDQVRSSAQMIPAACRTQWRRRRPESPTNAMDLVAIAAGCSSADARRGPTGRFGPATRPQPAEPAGLRCDNLDLLNGVSVASGLRHIPRDTVDDESDRAAPQLIPAVSGTGPNHTEETS
jgi:hypothetical protein